MGESEKDVEEANARAEREVADLQRRSDDVAEHIETARDEWQRKRNDPSVPGAVPPEDADHGAMPADTPGEDSAA